MLKGYLAGFQYCELTSGSVAAPTSPIEPARASGAMVCEVTAVFTGLNMSSLSFCPLAVSEQSESKGMSKAIFMMLFIRLMG